MWSTGEWDEALERVDEALRLPDFAGTWLNRLLPAVSIHVHRGRLDLARELLESCSSLEHSEEIQSRTFYAVSKAVLLRGEEEYEDALAAAAEAAHAREELGAGSAGVKLGLVEEIEAAMFSDRARAEALVSDLERLRPGETRPFLRAQTARLRANLSPTASDQEFATAVTIFRELSVPFYLGVTLLEQGERLAAVARTADAARLLTEAREIFERLQARPWLDRLARTTIAETISA